MKHFHIIDNLLGWLTFAIAATVYGLTIEPTASFWDCPEFIISGYKLEIGHPPGAPFFMLTANLFALFASSPEQVARMVNLMSALLSALTILFLFWTISHLVRRLLSGTASPTPRQAAIVWMSSLVGALIYTFSDTFWFSAVEGEVYAFSSAFTAAVFWMALKWESHADEPQSDRWLVLIAYLMGLSIGVHLLNLLCLPAIVLVFYYRRFPEGRRFGLLLALLFSFLLIAAILFVLIPGMCTLGGWCELLLVNVMGAPFNTGLVVYLMILFPLLFAAIVYTHRRGMRIVNTTLLCLLMIMLGYGSYAVTFIRSSANPPMDQNAPKDIFALGRYLARDQYEHGPLFYGQAYTSQPRRQRRQGHLSAQTEREHRRKGQLYRHGSPHGHLLWATDALPAHVEQPLCKSLRGLDGWQQREGDLVRPLRRNGTSAHAIAMGQPALFHRLPV